MEPFSLQLFMGPLLLLVCVGLMCVPPRAYDMFKDADNLVYFFARLFGTFCCQVYIYWYTYDDDPKFLKSYVMVVWWVYLGFSDLRGVLIEHLGSWNVYTARCACTCSGGTLSTTSGTLRLLETQNGTLLRFSFFLAMSHPFPQERRGTYFA